jgi:hypothetical protein
MFHVGAVVVLAAAVAAAQAPKDKSKPAQASASQDRQSSAPSVSEREMSTGMATGRRQHQPVTITARESSQPSVSELGVVSAREASSGMATGRKSGSVIAHDRDSVTTARESGSGLPTGKAVSGDPHVNENARNSAHATESLDAASKDAAKLSEAHSNPMYKDNGLQGTNPLYQGKDKMSAPPSGNGPKPVVEYKDGEDGTTHTRPGNHKPGK